MMRMALVPSLCLLIACESVAPDVETSALGTVVASFEGGRLKDYAFRERPICDPDSRQAECTSHSRADLDQIRMLRADVKPKDGWSFALSPVRDSAGTKVVEVSTMIDPIEPGYACAVLYRVVLDRSGLEILSSEMVMSDFLVSQRR